MGDEFNHAWDEENLPNLHKSTGAVDGGACLNRHGSSSTGPDGFYKPNSCCHPWQAFERGLQDDSHVYNGSPGTTVHAQDGDKRWYDPFLASARGGRPLVRLIRVGSNAPRTTKSKGMLKRVPSPAPKPKEWDISAGGKPYHENCSYPILHEAHHIVAADELRQSIAQYTEGKKLEAELVKKIRKGLLEAMYNLNHKDNMIILPIERRFARAIGLPRHRFTPWTPNHQTYSDYIRKKVNAKLAPIQAKLQDCRDAEVDYSDLRQGIEGISAETRTQIFEKGLQDRGAALDRVLRPEMLPQARER